MNGFLNVYKSPGWTSHDVVQKVRKSYRIKKVGHLGTLDPGACGVLPLALGKGTKLSQYILTQDKVYRFELTLGMATDTLDDEGTVIDEAQVNNNDVEQLLTNYHNFIGEIEQVPPMYSAIKQDGQKLYELARKGETVERPSRKVTIYSLECLDHYLYEGKRKLLFEVSCSKGTYIRTLAKDLAELTDCGIGYMSYLIRKQTGDFNVDQSKSIDDLPSSQEKLGEILYPLDYPLYSLPKVNLTDPQLVKRIINGNFINLDSNCSRTKEELYRVYDYTDNNSLFIGIGKFVSPDTFKPEKIIL